VFLLFRAHRVSRGEADLTYLSTTRTTSDRRGIPIRDDTADEWSPISMPFPGVGCSTNSTSSDQEYSRLHKKIVSGWAPCVGKTQRPLFVKNSSLLRRGSHQSAATMKARNKEKPNIVLILADALSRAHAMRALPTTMEWFRKHGAISLGRYHITGFHSEENQWPLFTGIEYKGNDTKRTKLTEIAKRNGYLTQYASTANLQAKGCVRSDFDYWNAKHALRLINESVGFCIGDTAASSIALRGTLDFFMAHPGELKFTFLYFEEPHWYKPVSEDGIWANALDHPIKYFLENLPELERTEIYFLSDHGSLFWEQRTRYPTATLEHKLPVAVILSPRAKDPRSLHARSNKWQLTTPYDMHATISASLGSRSLFTNGSDVIFEKLQRGKNCEEYGIPSSYCLCAAAEMISLNSTDISVRAALDFINKLGHLQDPAHCQPLEFVRFREDSSRMYIREDEYQYELTFETTFERVFSATIFHGMRDKDEGFHTSVLEVRQLTAYDAFRKCSRELMKQQSAPGTVPPSIQYCACIL